jgi:hypothetical protein
MRSQTKPPATRDVAIGNAESRGAHPDRRSQSLGLIAIHEIDNHIIPVMTLDLDDGFSGLRRDLWSIVPGEQEAAGWSGSEAGSENER